MKKVILCVALFVLAGFASAELYDWGGSPSFSITDPLNDQTEDSRNIQKLWYAFAGGNHYFRLDVEGAPQQLADEFAPEYSIHIDFKDGGAGNADSDYVSINLTGIDALVDSHYTLFSGFGVNHVHIYDPIAVPNPPKFTTTGPDAVEQNGATLEWCVSYDALRTGDGEFCIYGVTYDIDGTGETFDLTDELCVSVPEPMTMGLLGLGGLLIRRRK